MKQEVCFYIPKPLARGYKTHNEFHKYHMKLELSKIQEKQFYLVLLLIFMLKTHQRRGVTYDVIDELRRLSLSKCFPALCHKLIYEIAIFHFINRESFDITNYVNNKVISWSLEVRSKLILLQ